MSMPFVGAHEKTYTVINAAGFAIQNNEISFFNGMAFG